MPIVKSAGAIVYRIKNNKLHYLLLHYPSGHWEFPRGHIDEGESEQETAIREIEEETGLKDIKMIPNFKGYSRFFFKRTYGLKPKEKKKAPWVFKLVTLFLAETKTEDIKLSREHKGFVWLPYEDAIKKLPKDAKKVFNKANDHLISRKSF